MKLHPECGPCLIHWVFERTVPYTPDTEITRLVRDILGILIRDTSPQTNEGSICNTLVQAVFASTPGLSLHYEDLKQKSNENAKKVIPEAAKYIQSGKTPHSRVVKACLIAAAANVAPLKAPSSPYTFHEIRDIIDQGDKEKVIASDLFDILKNSRHVLYVTDNAGEIGFDALAIREIKDIGPKVTLVVKSATYFEDATLEDANAFGIERLVDEIVVVPGFLVPNEMAPSVARIFESSDLVIAKGTGSCEALHGEEVDKKVAYLLKVKCKAIARELGVEEGKITVKVD